MAIKASAHIVAIGPYDDSNNQIEVRMVAKRGDNSEVDMSSQVFVVPISSNWNQDVRDAVKEWTGTNWSVDWQLLDTVQLFGGSSLL